MRARDETWAHYVSVTTMLTESDQLDRPSSCTRIDLPKKTNLEMAGAWEGAGAAVAALSGAASGAPGLDRSSAVMLVRIVFALTPSSAAAERIFSLLKAMFGKDQNSSLPQVYL